MILGLRAKLRWWELCATIGAAAFGAGCAYSPTPALTPLSARIWTLPGDLAYDDVLSVVEELAPRHGYTLSHEQFGVLLRSERFYAATIDDHCVYPVINSKTGRQMNTFASLQSRIMRLPGQLDRAWAAIQIEIPREEGPIRAKSFCRAYTELGIQPAESTGNYERELFEDLLRDLRGSTFDAPSERTNREEPVAREAECDLYTELKKLGELRDQGLLTEEEFMAKKKSVLERCD
jgi:hypothetical protein